jgi:hypothetical protein
MATLNRMLTTAAFAYLAFSGCGKLVGLNTPVTPLAQIQLQVTGDFGSVQRADTVGQTPNLRVAMVWGAQWQPEPFCFLQMSDVMPPPESPGVDAVKAAGCPDSFRFVPDSDDADIAVIPGALTTITLVSLPRAEVMVGDLTARVAYASLIVYDDRNGNGTLDFHHPPRHRRRGQPDVSEDAGASATWDVVYGASFISMTMPDQRLAYREGSFDNSVTGVAFYPRYGCGEPLPSFSILSAGGFSQAAAVDAALQHQLPEEAPPCVEATLDQAVVNIALQAPTTRIAELACAVNDGGGATFYSRPPEDSPDLLNLKWACVGFPEIPGDDAGIVSGIQLVVASPPSAACQSVTHYILRGCDDDPGCSTGWDLTALTDRPAWWPCTTTP